ncbi:MAG: hypothetical protein DDT21_00118 [Syntrophomonadaceae bacterium]|nr:hypothetical protein [Bacillota bacterium]
MAREILRDDGVETQQVFEVVGALADGRALPALHVPRDRFAAMNWPLEWGMQAVVSAGQGSRDKLREAVQLLSQSAGRERVFTHIGWRKLDGRWVYLHAGGAIGADGLSVAPDVDMLRRYRLPAEPGNIVEAVRTSLGLIDLAAHEVTLPLWAAAFRAPTACLYFPDFTIFLHGQTGSFKSTLAALFLCHFGEFTHRSLPESWLSTENSLEKTASLCRDALMIVDDYAPEQHHRDAAALDKRVHRFLRQLGNRQNRNRLRSDLTGRPAYLPNCFAVATGEQLPLGVGSAAARMLPIEVLKKTVDTSVLTAAQGKSELLPFAMRGYIEWLLPQMDKLSVTLPRHFTELRSKALVNGHARLPEIVANLQIGMEMGLQYAVEAGAATQSEAGGLLAESWRVLLALAEKHGKLLQQERPVMKFAKTLEAIFTQRLGHLVDRQTGLCPENGDRYGWDMSEPCGKKLGWADEQGIYLQPAAAWAGVNEFHRYGDRIAVRERTMREMLAREGVTMTRDGRLTEQARCEGKRREVLHIAHEKLEALLSTESAYTAYTDKKEAENSSGTGVSAVGTFDKGLPTSAYKVPTEFEF